jgi:hypothetical protein
MAIAAALFNARRQIGGVLGLAVLTTVTTPRTQSLAGAGHRATTDAVTAGSFLGLGVAAAMFSQSGLARYSLPP